MFCTRLSPQKAKELYEEVLAADFPPAELRPVKWVAEMLARGQYFGYLFTDGETPIAYAFLCRASDAEIYLVDYFAVFSPYRSQGFGSVALRALQAEFAEAEALFFEVDHPDFADSAAERTKRDRRLAFYYRGGLADTDVRTCVWGCEFQILALDGLAKFRGQAAADALDKIYRILFPNRFYTEHVVFHPPYIPQNS